MMHRVSAPAFGVLAAAILAIGSPSKALAADPSGIWAKDDGSAKVEIKKCGGGLCGAVVWVRNPKDSRGNPLHDVRNENPSLRGRPIIGLPLFSNMRATEPNSWVGNVYNPVEGRIYTNVKLSLVSRQQIVLRGCKTFLLCGEKTWTRSSLPPGATQTEALIEAKAPAAPAAREKPIEVKAPVKPAPQEKPIEVKAPAAPVERGKPIEVRASVVPAPRERPIEIKAPVAPVTPEWATEVQANVDSVVPEKGDLEVPTVQAAREKLPAPGFTVVSSSARPDAAPLSGDRVTGLVAMAAPSTAAGTTSAPTETAAADEEQWPWLKRRAARRASARAVAQAQTPKPAAAVANPKPVVVAAREVWPWEQRRPRLVPPMQASAAAMPIYMRSAPQPVVVPPQAWQRRPVVLVANGSGVY
jgi:uncharacterized protein (DUF2147 family)